MLSTFFHSVKMQSGKYRQKVKAEMDQQRGAFRKECPTLTEKRAAAIEYLGENWILAKQSQKLPVMRRV
jgi:hypothetical protein